MRAEKDAEILADQADRLCLEGELAGAEKCYFEASALGHVYSKVQLAQMYEDKNDPGLYGDIETLYLEAANGGSVTAMYSAGSLYEEGVIVRRDTAKAISFYESGARTGDVDCLESYAALSLAEFGPEATYQRIQEMYGEGFGLDCSRLILEFCRENKISEDEFNGKLVSSATGELSRIVRRAGKYLFSLFFVAMICLFFLVNILVGV